MRVALVPLMFPLIVLAGCGARTDPDVAVGSGEHTSDTSDASVVETSAPETTGETGFDVIVPSDVAEDAPVDTVIPFDTRPCLSDDDCDDHVACSLDTCDSGGFCAHVSVSGRCDDGRFCNGEEQCDVFRGCLPGVRDCGDGVSCTHDSCDEKSRSCGHAPDDALCPVSHGCDPVLGCQARALAQTADSLFEIRLPSGKVRRIGSTGATLTDIALHPGGVLYGVSFSSLSKIDTLTGTATPFASVSTSFNALDFAPDGTLYAAGGNTLYSLDPATGISKRIATFPAGLSSSGDIAFVGGRLVATATGGGATDLLIEMSPASGVGKTLGSVGYRCVWGLAAYGPTLYGLTCEGNVLSIDPFAGTGTVVSTAGESFYGASAR